jgi:archaellum component FlaC
MDENLARIAELDERIKSLESTIEQLADNFLKFEKTLDDIASYIVPQDDETNE